MRHIVREQLAEIRDELFNTESENVPTEDTSEVSEVLDDTEIEESETTEEEEEVVEYFNDLPDVLGIEAEAFYDLKLKTDTGNKYTWSEVKDLVQAHEKGGDAYEAKVAELAEKERMLNTAMQQSAQQNQAVSAEVAQAGQELQGIEQLYNTLMGQLDDVNNSGDTETSTRVQAELIKLQHAHGVAQQKLQRAQAQQAAQQQQAYGSYLASQRGMLEKLLPEWREPETRKQQQTEMREYLSKAGLQPQEISSITDARLVLLIDKARKWDMHSSQVKQTSDNLRSKTVKRIVKGAKATDSTKVTNLKQTVARAKQSKTEQSKKAAYRAIAEDAGLL